MSYKRNHKVEVAVHQMAKKDNYHCGDSYFYEETKDGFICAIADGLGSGKSAKESSEAVMAIIRENVHITVEQLVKKANEQLTGRRGVVLGILKMHFPGETFAFSSIGNIGLMTVDEYGKKNRNIPNPGYLAGYKRDFKVMRGRLEAGIVFYLFSDGVTDKDLSHPLFLTRDVHAVIRQFAEITGKNRSDDTTLISMQYLP